MIPYVRKKFIMELLDDNELVYLDDIKKVISDVSESTIKRDLRILASQGSIRMLRGGAIAKVDSLGASFDVPIEAKAEINAVAKKRIASYAATLINEGEVVFIDSSTTTIPIIHFLKNMPVTIVTSNIQATSLNNSSCINYIVIGGELIKRTGSVVGPLTEGMLSKMFFDKAFIGANGFSKMAGVTTPDFRESSKKQIVYQNSGITYVLMDSSKENITTLSKVFDLNQCNIITDKKMKILEEFKSSIVVPDNWSENN